MPTHIMKLSIIFFVTTINNVFASFPKVKFGKFNREFGFNLTVKELNQDIILSLEVTFAARNNESHKIRDDNSMHRVHNSQTKKNLIVKSSGPFFI